MSTTSDTTTPWTLPETPVAPASENRPSTLPPNWSLAELLEHLGDVPPERVRLYPFPGTATEEDAVSIEDHEDRLFELVDGVLVEKDMAFIESMLAIVLSHLLLEYLDKNRLGVITGESGMMRVIPTRMRMPDVAFTSYDRFPDGKVPHVSVFDGAPDLAVEVISKGNRKGEMQIKLREYFAGGVRLVWYIDPKKRTAQIYTAVDEVQTIDENGDLDGRNVLPGFKLRLGELFERAEQSMRRPD